MRTFGKILAALSALPVAVCALCLGAVFVMGVLGEPSKDAGLVPLVGFAITLVPAGIGLFGLLLGLALWQAGKPPEGPEGPYVRMGYLKVPFPVSDGHDRTR